MGKDDGFTRHDVLELGRKFDVHDRGAGIIAQVDSALGMWTEVARAADVPQRWIARIGGSFRRFI